MKTVDPEIIEFTKQALMEMSPLEVGFMLRDLGFGFTTTMHIVRHVIKKMNITIETYKNKDDMAKIGTGVGFTRDQTNEARKLEIIKHDKQCWYYLWGKLGNLIAKG